MAARLRAKEKAVYTVIRRYQGDPTALAGLARKVGDTARDIITTIPGFVAYGLADDGKGTMLTVGTFDDKAGADESTRRAAAWIRDNAADVRLAAPTIIEGTTRVRKAVPGMQAKYGVLRTYKVNPGSVDEIVKRAEEGFIPLISKSPGFVRYMLIDAGNGSLATTSVFETQEQAENSVKLAADWVKQNLSALVPNPPEVTSGQIKVNWLK
jgi:hypothetical protein